VRQRAVPPTGTLPGRQTRYCFPIVVAAFHHARRRHFCDGRTFFRFCSNTICLNIDRRSRLNKVRPHSFDVIVAANLLAYRAIHSDRRWRASVSFYARLCGF